MEEIVKNLNEEELGNVTGGVQQQSGNPNGAHWVYPGVGRGQTFEYAGSTWYKINSGDHLGGIALRFGIAEREGITGSEEYRAVQGCYILQRRNPATIEDIAKIYVDDCIALY